MVVAVLAALPGFSQAVRSPFTTFGIGEPYGNALIQSQGMGGVGVSQPQYWYINNQNPALLIHNTVTAFQAGVVGESRTLKGDTINETVRGGNLNYLATAFPVKVSKWSTSLGLMPYTAVNYAIQYFDYATNSQNQVVDTLLATESGSGGLTQFYWSNGVRLTRQLSVGLKAAYLFGPIETNFRNRTTNNEQNLPFIVEVKEKITAKDFLFTAGLAYSIDSVGSRNRYRLSMGGTYSFATDVKASHRSEILLKTLNGSVIGGDTLLTNGGSLKIPGSLTFGVSFSRRGIWSIGTEVTYQDWTSYRNVAEDGERLEESYRVALGGEITPDALAGENYLKRVTYRVGLVYEKYPFVVNGNPVNDFGINFGFSLPAGRSSLDLAFKVGKRGDRAENLLGESYFKVYFGLTFNDQWFIRRKFD
jgi:hypothetical protein